MCLLVMAKLNGSSLNRNGITELVYILPLNAYNLHRLQQVKQVKLWFYKLPPTGLAAVRKIQNGTILENKLGFTRACRGKKELGKNV